MKILITCPPMIKQIKKFDEKFKEFGMKYFCPEFTQTLTENELLKIVPLYDGWIIGDDQATKKVFEKGVLGKLKAVVKWGVGVDNVDINACEELGLSFTNIPKVFGEEVSDVAIGYMICLARKLHCIDRCVKNGEWIKPCGISLYNKKVCQIGFGDIGKCLSRKLMSFNMQIYVSDPEFFQNENNEIISKYDNRKLDDIFKNIKLTNLNEAVFNADFIIIVCALNKSTYHLVNKDLIIRANKGVKIINVARGPIVVEKDVIELLENKYIDSIAFDVFEDEPLKYTNKLIEFPQNMFGSHNASNTIEGVEKTSLLAINYINKFLNMKNQKY